MRKVGGFVLAAVAVLLVASGLVSAGSGRPLADPTSTVGVFLPYIFLKAVPGQTPEPAPDLKITALQHETRDEYVEITNQGTAAQDMTGWRIHSVVGDQWYDFPAGFTLGAGATVRVHSGPDAFDSPPVHLPWATLYIWNNNGDKAILYDGASQAVDSYCYGNGCP